MHLLVSYENVMQMHTRSEIEKKEKIPQLKLSSAFDLHINFGAFGSDCDARYNSHSSEEEGHMLGTLHRRSRLNQ